MALPALQPVRLGDYQLLSKIGAGGMGVVYKATDLKLRRTVALKFLSGDDSDRQRLLTEARAASALDHPNIAAVHAVEETGDGRLFLVMAYYEGETLADKLQRGPLQPQTAIHIACQVARGLQHAHARGVIHRDIKPSNIIVTREGIAKIVDFGLARQYTATATTQACGLSGTLLYMSPEQAAGRVVDNRTDIWSLGVLLYQMLTGRLPFSGDSAAGILLAILNASPAPPSGVADEVQLILYRALAKDPAARYASCAELLRDLAALASDDRQRTASLDTATVQRVRHAAQAAASTRLLAPPASQPLDVIASVFRWFAIAIGVLILLLLLRAALPSLRTRWEPSAARAGPPQTAAVYDSYLRGRAALERYDRAGNLDQAVTHFETAIRGDPQFALAYASLGETFWQKYRLENDPRWLAPAETYSRRAIELDDQLPSVHITLGRLHLNGKQRELALQEFQQALKLDPRNAEALRGTAAVYNLMGRRSEAEALYVRATTLAPDSWTGFNEFGTFYLGHDNEKAAAQYRRAVELTPDNALARSNLGLALEELGQDAAAEAEFQHSLRLRPTYPAYTMLGRLYYRRQRWAESAAMIEKALQLNRADYRVWANLALAYEWMGQTVAAGQARGEELVRIEEASRLAPDDAAVLVELGRLYARGQRRHEAVTRLEAALAHAPQDAEIAGTAAEAYAFLGDSRRAADLLERALSLGLDWGQVERSPGLQSLRRTARFQRFAVGRR